MGKSPSAGTPIRERGQRYFIEDLVLTAERADFFQRLHDTDLVVDGHDRHEKRVFVHRLLQYLHIDEAVRLHWQVSDFETFLLQLPAAVQNALVLSLQRDDVVALFVACPIETRNSLDGHIVTLRRAAGENNLFFMGTNQGCNGAASSLHSDLSFPPEDMAGAVRIAVLPRQQRQHRIQNTGIYLGGTLTIKKYGPLVD